MVKDNIPQIISGSGSKIEPVKNSDGGIYAHATNGFAIVEVFENGGTNLKFINARNDKVEFETTVIQPNPSSEKKVFSEKFPDSIKASIYSEAETSKSNLYNFFCNRMLSCSN